MHAVHTLLTQPFKKMNVKMQRLLSAAKVLHSGFSFEMTCLFLQTPNRSFLSREQTNNFTPLVPCVLAEIQ